MYISLKTKAQVIRILETDNYVNIFTNIGNTLMLLYCEVMSSDNGINK